MATMKWVRSAPGPSLPNKDTLRRVSRVMTVVQPYANHNAGQIQFGPDGMLYVGMGDGGWQGDPHNHGQRTDTLLGSMLRIDVDGADTRGYSIPQTTLGPMVWTPLQRRAVGIRNPWKFSFAPDGRMLLADVGQNAWEEVNIVSAGDNLGWKIKEATHCGPKRDTCASDDLVDPIFEYPHDIGSSITGGFVATGGNIPAIDQHYVFGDFVGSPVGHPSSRARRRGHGRGEGARTVAVSAVCNPDKRRTARSTSRASGGARFIG